MRARRLEIALGVLWVLDGLLQFQPYMFTKEFYEGILGMANMGLPHPASVADDRVASLLVAHPAPWNTVFALLQLMLGIGLLYRRTAKVSLAVSIPWAMGVWIVGEGFGGLFMGGTSLVNGAPGPAILYAVLAVLAWPGVRPGIRNAIGTTAWVVAWAGSALLELEPLNHAPSVPAAQIANARLGEPSWLAWLNTVGGDLIGTRGLEFAALLATVAIATGLGVLWRPAVRPALVSGMVLAVVVGVFGQDLGGIATRHGTDPGSGPLLFLLALTLWPIRNPVTNRDSALKLARARRTVPQSEPEDVPLIAASRRPDLRDPLWT